MTIVADPKHLVASIDITAVGSACIIKIHLPLAKTAM